MANKPLSPRAAEQLRKIQQARIGSHHTDATKQKISLAKKGKPGHPCSIETKQKVSEAQKGVPLSDEQRSKHLALRRTPEYRQKLSQSHKGVPLSHEHRERMIAAARTQERRQKVSQQHTGMRHTAEDKLKMSIAKKGKPLSFEHRLHISQANKGHPTSIDTRLKISRSLKGVPLSPEHRLKTAQINKARKGIPLSAEHKAKVSQSSLRMWRKPGFHEKRSGENNPFWRGGRAVQHYTPEFNRWMKKSIKNRDGNRCYSCYSTLKLCVHHIDYDKRNCDPQNLVTLCRSCHAKTGTRRDYWLAYFQTIMNSEEMLKANSLLPCYKLLVTPN